MPDRDTMIQAAMDAIERHVKSLPYEAREFWWSGAPLYDIVGVIVDGLEGSMVLARVDCCTACDDEHRRFWTDHDIFKVPPLMFLCPDCGNKRCPKAINHRFVCTDVQAVAAK